MSDTEELHIGDFNPSTYEHVLPEGAHDFNNFDSDYEEQHPELGLTDEQVEAEVAKLDPEDKKFYKEYHDFLDTYYRQHGKIIEMPDLIKLIMTGRYPEIPSTTRKEQDELREKLMIETTKREMSQQAGLEEEPPRKIRRIVPERFGKIIDVTGDDDPDAPTIIKITPGVDPYAQLDLEEEELEYKVDQTVQMTPRPATTLPQCAEDLLTELGNEELFRRILAVGYMSYQAFEKNHKKRLGETYKPNTIREVAARFNISTSRLMDLRRGAAINREDTQRAKMLKAEKKEETEGKTPTGSQAASPEEQSTPQLSTPKE